MNKVPETSNASDAVQQDQHRQSVRAAYANVADGVAGGCGDASGCCGDTPSPTGVSSRQLGYSDQDVSAVPAGADLGLGCGNPKAIAALQPGEVVVDLGSGAGFDCFLAAREVGPTGQVIGVDMTPAMITKARANAAEGDYPGVSFRLGEIEQLPVADGVADVVISNCVINLSPDKLQVFREAYRVLKPGGRLAVSDVVATRDIPDAMRSDQALVASCLGNAARSNDLIEWLAAAGFSQIQIRPKDASRQFIKDWAPGQGVETYVLSASIEAIKPVVPV